MSMNGTELLKNKISCKIYSFFKGLFNHFFHLRGMYPWMNQTHFSQPERSQLGKEKKKIST